MTWVLYMAVRLRVNGARLRVTHVFFRTDLYDKNIRSSDTSLLHRDGNLMNPLGKPKIGNVRPVDEFGNVQSVFGQTSTARVPRYLVRSPQSFPRILPYPARYDPGISIIGFGERFLAGKMPGAEFHFHYQAPELVFSSQISSSADIWSLGCLVCYLVRTSLKSELTLCKDI